LNCYWGWHSVTVVCQQDPLVLVSAYHYSQPTGDEMKSRQSWAELYAFEVNRADNTPLFRQLYQQLRSAILSRQLRSGAKLPSTRELASQLGVSRSAAVSAYEQLLAEGYTSGRRGSGTYVSSDLAEPIDGNAQRGEKPVTAITSGATQMHSVGDFVDVTVQSEERPFNLGRTLVDARTVELWRKLSARTFRSLNLSHLGYSDPRGTIELRNTICEYLQAARAVRCDPEQIVVTTGTQHALDIVIRILSGPDKEVWVEDPGYPLTRQALMAAGATVRPIPVDGQGIDVGAGIKSAPNARAVFVTPSHQFPTGVVLSMARRLELLAWARKKNAWIVEDDYASEFRYGGRPLASLQGLDEGERVIYIGTLNKALFPGLRMGYAVVPRALLRAFVAARYLMDRQPSTLCQAVVAAFMEEGHFAAHIRRMRLLYRDQRDVLVAALKSRLGADVTVDAPDQGMHLVAYTRRGLSDVAIERAGRQHGVIVRAMSRLHVAAAPRSALVLGFSGYPRQTIGPAVESLAQVVEGELKSSPRATERLATPKRE
jgi:GntR family transcriptional regulator / MocR family aminotransferase